MDELIRCLSSLRVPLQQGEYDLHRIVEEQLTAGGIPWEHEVSIAPRCRIDLLCGTIGLELKRGMPDRRRILAQLERYAASERISGIILVTERTVSVPRTLCGKPVRVICLNRLWGIAL